MFYHEACFFWDVMPCTLMKQDTQHSKLTKFPYFFSGTRPQFWWQKRNTLKPGYNDIGLGDTSPIASDVLWYQIIPHR
jgi:hypothetical protein